MKRYDPKVIESSWQKKWEENRTFKVDIQKAKRPFFNLMMFPYPSGEGLHVGHVYAFGGADTFGRFKRMQGYDVFEPMGFDSFGIHSENYAIKVGKHPKDLIDQTTKYFREEQLKKLGALFDWDKQVITSDKDYYRWTQWLFIQLFKAGLAVRKKSPVDWCPSCKTVLADEQVVSGKCERCGTEVIQKELEQWFFKITSYAQRLLDNLSRIDWSETTKTMQRNWIGRSEGTEIEFRIQNSRLAVGQAELRIKVFTTRPDTIFGATFMVLAPEHPVVAQLLKSKDKSQNSKIKEVEEYVGKAKAKSEVDREKEKTGLFTGLYCVNPLTKKEIPIWIADYVLGSYGTGAIMAVPAHDQRDWDFAKDHDLPIVKVIKSNVHPRGGQSDGAFEGEGVLINSGEFNGLGSKEAIKKISEYIDTNHLGKRTVNYHLRDWLISRQRYWGPPIPMIYCEKCASGGKSWFTADGAKAHHQKLQLSIHNDQTNSKSQIPKGAKFGIWKLEIDASRQMAGWYPVPEEDLPVELPFIKNYQPKGAGVSPLAQVTEFVNVKCPGCGSLAKRETDVSDTFLDSSWYFLRYPVADRDDIPFPSKAFVKNSKHEARNSKQTKDSNKENSELFGNSDFDIRAYELTSQWLPVDMYIGGNEHAVLHLLYTRFVTMALHDIGLLDFEEPFKKFRAHGLVIHSGAKMSKSRGNVVNPNEFIEAYGADTLRIYLLFLGPYDQGGDFSDRAISGVFRFLNRVWALANEVAKVNNKDSDQELETQLNRLVKKVGDDFASLKFNTAVASLMEFLNLMHEKKDSVSHEALKNYILLLAPLAPHFAEEVWTNFLGLPFSVHNQSWPKFDEKQLVKDIVTIAIQVNGKFRGKLEAARGVSKEEATRLALDLPKVKAYIEKEKVKKSIWIEGRLLNLVTGN